MPFERSLDTFLYATFVALGSTIVSASGGVGSLLLGGLLDHPRAGLVWMTWWLGNTVSDLLLAR